MKHTVISSIVLSVVVFVSFSSFAFCGDLADALVRMEALRAMQNQQGWNNLNYAIRELSAQVAHNRAQKARMRALQQQWRMQLQATQPKEYTEEQYREMANELNKVFEELFKGANTPEEREERARLLIKEWDRFIDNYYYGQQSLCEQPQYEQQVQTLEQIRTQQDKDNKEYMRQLQSIATQNSSCDADIPVFGTLYRDPNGNYERVIFSNGKMITIHNIPQ